MHFFIIIPVLQILIMILVFVMLIPHPTTGQMDMERDISLLKNLTQIKTNPSIMFWRPQKVGSSTFLSLLVSYGFRYNLLPRRKGTMNSMCKRVAKCSLDAELKRLSSTGIAGQVSTLTQYLTDYLSGRVKGSGRMDPRTRVSTGTYTVSQPDLTAEMIPYKISLTHDICNMGAAMIADHLPCALHTTRETLREVILLREPLSRALSVYYFWGELFKMSANRRSKSRQSKRTKSTQTAPNSEIAHPASRKLKNAVSDAVYEDYDYVESDSEGIEYSEHDYYTYVQSLPITNPLQHNNHDPDMSFADPTYQRNKHEESSVRYKGERVNGDNESWSSLEIQYHYDYTLLSAQDTWRFASTTTSSRNHNRSRLAYGAPVAVISESSQSSHASHSGDKPAAVEGNRNININSSQHIQEEKQSSSLSSPQLGLDSSAYSSAKPEQQQEQPQRQLRRHKVTSRLGLVEESSSVSAKAVKGTFLYHGDETTPPPEESALKYAAKLPYRAGMPGPSFTWSAFATSVSEAVSVLRSGRVFALVTERLDESLVVASHFLGMSIADMVVTKPRKALSRHPRYKDWPPSAVNILNQTLHENGEFEFYESAVHILDFRIHLLKSEGVEFDKELLLLRELRERVTAICLTDEYLERYRSFIEGRGLQQHIAGGSNKLRDTEDRYAEEGHSFSLNREILYSYDVCGGCEAHAILYSIQHNNNIGISVKTAPLLKELDRDVIHNNTNFINCPL